MKTRDGDLNGQWTAGYKCEPSRVKIAPAAESRGLYGPG